MSSASEGFPYIPPKASYTKFEGSFVQDDTTSLPSGFPEEITSQPLWSAPGIQEESTKWTYNFTDDDRAGIRKAVDTFQGTGKRTQELSRGTFLLPEALVKTLDDARESLYNGFGFQLFRGINLDSYQPEERIIVHAGLTSYFGDLRGYCTPFLDQTPVLAHVTDLHKEDKNTSPAHHNGAMTFHTDLGDIVSIFTLDRGPPGDSADNDGGFYLASAWNVYNDLARNRRKILNTLSQNFEMNPVHSGTPRSQPLLHLQDGRVFLQSFRRPFTTPSSIILTEDQQNALDAIHIAAQPGSLKIDFQNGDLLLFNNLALLHSRATFKSAADEANPRHLLKLFVKDKALGWNIPTVLQGQWNVLYGDRTKPQAAPLADVVGNLTVGGQVARVETFDLTPPGPDDPPVEGWSQNG